MKHWILKQWFYFRMGYQNYWAFPIGYASNALVLYVFAFKEFLNNLFIFLGLSTVFISPVCIIFGYLHTMRKSAWSIDAAKGTEVNPYNNIAVPGKEKDVYLPVAILQLEILEKVTVKEGLMTPELAGRFAENKEKLEWLKKN